MTNPTYSPEASAGMDAASGNAASLAVAAIVDMVLRQVALTKEEKARISLPLPNGERQDYATLLITSNILSVSKNFPKFVSWLKEPGINPLNSAAYASYDLLTKSGIAVAPAGISAFLIIIDILSSIIRPGDQAVKTSLFAILKLVDAYRLGYKAARLAVEEVLEINTPFIAAFRSEHYVTVTGADEANAYYMDMGEARKMSRLPFVHELSGFVLARNLERHASAYFEYISETMAAFVWG